jgi:hypothetical protein
LPIAGAKLLTLVDRAVTTVMAAKSMTNFHGQVGRPEL